MNFNSIKVRLEPEDCEDTSYSLSYFNSIKVRLEQQDGQKVNHKNDYFNSIKVRLEPLTKFLYSAPFVFQFHKGTIRTRVNLGTHQNP